MSLDKTTYWKRITAIFIGSLLACYGVLMNLPMIEVISVIMVLYTFYSIGKFISQAKNSNREFITYGIIIYSVQSLFSIMLVVSSFTNNEILNLITVILGFATFVVHSWSL